MIGELIYISVRTRAFPRLFVGLVLICSVVVLQAGPADAAARCFGHRATKTGTGGRDRLEGTPRRDVIVGRAGNDLLLGFGAGDFLCGNSGNDTLIGVGGNDRLNGDGGFDVLLGMKGNDRSRGGPGKDLLSFFYSRHGVGVRLGAGRASGEGSDRFGGVENVEGSRRSDRLVGSNKKNLINGGRGSDRLFGKDGGDLLLGRSGRDRSSGGGGRDMASYFYSDGVDGDLADGVVKGEGRDRLRGIEGLEGSKRAGDRLSGNGGDNFLLGGRGSDRLFGLGGKDFVDGGKGNDSRVIGGGGNDFLDGGGGNDKLGALGTQTENGNDFLRGAGGNDDMFGGVGADLLEGGPGDDLFDGGADFDFATFTFARRHINANISTGEATGWGHDDLVNGPLPTIEGLQGSNRNDVLTGSSLANTIYGEKGNDDLFGLEENDLLIGGRDQDDLDGGLGIDTCRSGEQKTSCELPLFGKTAAAAPSEVVGAPADHHFLFKGLVEGAEVFPYPSARFVGGISPRRF
jgi:Ca2+-binding RTX toxin-like protein